MTLSDDIKATEKRIQVVLTSHHIILYVALAAALLGGTYLVMAKVAELKDAKAQAAEIALAVEKDHSAKLEQLFNASEAQRKLENAQFLATIQQVQSQAKVQIIHDKALPAPELGQRIETITGFKQGTVSLNANQDLIVPLPLAQDIAARLDQGIADMQTVVQQANVIKNKEADIADLKAIIVEDKKVLAAQIDTDTKVLNAEKAKNRKSKLKIAIIAYGAGWLSRKLIGF